MCVFVIIMLLFEYCAKENPTYKKTFEVQLHVYNLVVGRSSYMNTLTITRLVLSPVLSSNEKKIYGI